MATTSELRPRTDGRRRRSAARSPASATRSHTRSTSCERASARRRTSPASCGRNCRSSPSARSAPVLPRGRDRRDHALPRPQGPRTLTCPTPAVAIGHEPRRPWSLVGPRVGRCAQAVAAVVPGRRRMGSPRRWRSAPCSRSSRRWSSSSACSDLFGAYEGAREFLTRLRPGAVLDTIEDAAGDTSTGTSVVALRRRRLGAIWAASGAMSSVIKAVNRAYDRVETRPFWMCGSWRSCSSP